MLCVTPLAAWLSVEIGQDCARHGLSYLKYLECHSTGCTDKSVSTWIKYLGLKKTFPITVHQITFLHETLASGLLEQNWWKLKCGLINGFTIFFCPSCLHLWLCLLVVVIYPQIINSWDFIISLPGRASLSTSSSQSFILLLYSLWSEILSLLPL